MDNTVHGNTIYNSSPFRGLADDKTWMNPRESNLYDFVVTILRVDSCNL